MARAKQSSFHGGKNPKPVYVCPHCHADDFTPKTLAAHWQDACVVKLVDSLETGKLIRG